MSAVGGSSGHPDRAAEPNGPGRWVGSVWGDLRGGAETQDDPPRSSGNPGAWHPSAPAVTYTFKRVPVN